MTYSNDPGNWPDKPSTNTPSQGKARTIGLLIIGAIIIISIYVAIEGPDPKKGEIWRYHHDASDQNPFKHYQAITVDFQVLDVRNGYVRYRNLKTGKTESSTVYYFKIGASCISRDSMPLPVDSAENKKGYLIRRIRAPLDRCDSVDLWSDGTLTIYGLVDHSVQSTPDDSLQINAHKIPDSLFEEVDRPDGMVQRRLKRRDSL